MKFRALIIDTAAMRDFMNITLGLSKFSKNCIMRITTRRVYFIISEEDSGPRRPLVWCELPVNFYFKEFNVVGVNDEYNEIYLEFSTALLARSLSILKQTVKSLKIKLTNKETPCLTIEMELMAGEIISRQVVHDIPVEIISRKHWSDYEEPRFNDFHSMLEVKRVLFLYLYYRTVTLLYGNVTVNSFSYFSLDFKRGKLEDAPRAEFKMSSEQFSELFAIVEGDKPKKLCQELDFLHKIKLLINTNTCILKFLNSVSIQMPNLKALKSIVERMKNMSHNLIVSANKNGRLTFQIKTNVVSLSSHFTDLSVQSFAVGQISNHNSSNENINTQVISSTVDIKKFLMFLAGLQINNCRTLCSIVDGKMVKLYMEQPGAISIQIFLVELNL